MSENTNSPDWLDSTREEIVVSARDYEHVLSGLMMPEEYFLPGAKIVSVGEGLSSFISELNQKFDVEGIAFDPMYQHGPKKEIQKQLTEGQMVYAHLREDKETDSEKGPAENEMVAGSVYDFPFKDRSLDLVIASYIAEHINLKRALPEMVRALKVGGEIRFSAAHFDIDPNEKIFLPFKTEYDGYEGTTFPSQTKDASEAIKWALKQQGLSLYVVTNGYNHRSEVRSEGLINSGLFIVRKDSKAPVVTTDINPDFGRIFKITSKPKLKEYIGQGFEVTELVPAKA